MDTNFSIDSEGAYLRIQLQSPQFHIHVLRGTHRNTQKIPRGKGGGDFEIQSPTPNFFGFPEPPTRTHAQRTRSRAVIPSNLPFRRITTN